MSLLAALTVLALAAPQNPRSDDAGAAALAEIRGLQVQIAAAPP